MRSEILEQPIAIEKTISQARSLKSEILKLVSKNEIKQIIFFARENLGSSFLEKNRCSSTPLVQKITFLPTKTRFNAFSTRFNAFSTRC